MNVIEFNKKQKEVEPTYKFFITWKDDKTTLIDADTLGELDDPSSDIDGFIVLLDSKTDRLKYIANKNLIKLVELIEVIEDIVVESSSDLS